MQVYEVHWGAHWARAAVVAAVAMASVRARADSPQLVDREAIALAGEGLAAARAGRFAECAEKDTAALQREDNARTRLHLAICQSKIGHAIDALRNAYNAHELAVKTGDDVLAKIAGERVVEISSRVAKVTFVGPTSVADLKVWFDEHPVPVESLGKRFSVDPGKHEVRAAGMVNGLPLQFHTTAEARSGEVLSITILLNEPLTPQFVSPETIRCWIAAKTQEELDKCAPPAVRPVVVRVGAEMAAYTDTTHVNVQSPAVRGSLSSPTAGWNVGASYLVDFVSAASPDIVSTASSNYRETRHVVSGTAGYKPALYGAQLSGNLSVEPDYFSWSVGGALTADVADKRATPRLGFTHTGDTIGRSHTPFKVWHKSFRVEEIEASTAFVLTPTAVLLLGLTVAAERGDQSKPYRFVPTFKPGDVLRVTPGMSVEDVNRLRTSARPAEALPTERDRLAGGFRFAKRFGQAATLRLDMRGYIDTWAIGAFSSDGRFMVDATDRIRLWPHARFHAQKGASFYRMATPVDLVGPTGTLDVMSYRTTDRELSQLTTVTAGGGVRVSLTNPSSGEQQVALTLTGDAMFTHYYKALFITDRTAYYGVLGLDWEF